MGNLVQQVQTQYEGNISSAKTAIDNLNRQIADKEAAIQQLNAQIQAKQAEVAAHEKLAAQYQQNWNTRYNCGGFKPPCNNWLDKRDAENRIVASLKAEVTGYLANLQNLQAQKTDLQQQLQNAQTNLSKLNADYQAALQSAQMQESAALAAQTAATNAANPVYQQQQAQIQLAAQQAEIQKATLAAQTQQATVQAQATVAAETAKAKESKNTLYIIVGTIVAVIILIATIILLKK